MCWLGEGVPNMEFEELPAKLSRDPAAGDAGHNPVHVPTTDSQEFLLGGIDLNVELICGAFR